MGVQANPRPETHSPAANKLLGLCFRCGSQTFCKSSASDSRRQGSATQATQHSTLARCAGDQRSRGGYLLTAQVHEPGGLLPVQKRVGRLAPRAEDVVIDIPPQHALKGLRHELPLHNQALLAIQGAAGTQLCHEECLHVLWLAVHGLAKVHEVDENCLLGALTSHLPEWAWPSVSGGDGGVSLSGI